MYRKENSCFTHLIYMYTSLYTAECKNLMLLHGGRLTFIEYTWRWSLLIQSDGDRAHVESPYTKRQLLPANPLTKTPFCQGGAPPWFCEPVRRSVSPVFFLQHPRRLFLLNLSTKRSQFIPCFCRRGKFSSWERPRGPSCSRDVSQGLEEGNAPGDRHAVQCACPFEKSWHDLKTLMII